MTGNISFFTVKFMLKLFPVTGALGLTPLPDAARGNLAPLRVDLVFG